MNVIMSAVNLKKGAVVTPLEFSGRELWRPTKTVAHVRRLMGRVKGDKRITRLVFTDGSEVELSSFTKFLVYRS